MISLYAYYVCDKIKIFEPKIYNIEVLFMRIEIITSTIQPVIPEGWTRAEEKYQNAPKNVDIMGKKISEDFVNHRYKLVNIIQSPFSWTERFGRFLLGIFTAIFKLDFGFKSKRVQGLFHKKYKFIRFINLSLDALTRELKEMSDPASCTPEKLQKLNITLKEKSKLFFNTKETKNILPFLLNNIALNLKSHPDICNKIIEHLIHLGGKPNQIIEYKGCSETLLTVIFREAITKQCIELIPPAHDYLKIRGNIFFYNFLDIDNELDSAVNSLTNLAIIFCKTTINSYLPVISLLQKHGALTTKQASGKKMLPSIGNFLLNLEYNIFEQISKTVKIMNVNFLLALHNENKSFALLPKELKQLICNLLLDSLLNEIDIKEWLK